MSDDDSPGPRPAGRLSRYVDKVVQVKAAILPRTEWQLKFSSDALEQSLCEICQKLRELSQICLSDTVYTRSSVLVKTADEGCLVCSIVKLAIEVFATNLRGYGLRDENRIRLRDFSRNHQLHLWTSRDSTLRIRASIEGLDLDSLIPETTRSYDIEVYTLTGELPRPRYDLHSTHKLIIYLIPS